ncbi:MAG: sodium:solute symporter, partial [Bryobacteraceae bacterium]|nr:sodium:solute symporter [Bryobacteraceae bacterium]
STHSATLNALASTTVMDFWRPLASARRSAPLSDAAALRLARGVTVVWEAVMLLIAWLARKWGPVLEAGLSIASVVYGSLLGAFLLGLLTRRVGRNAATVGMLAGLLVMLYIKAFTPVAWTWYALIGAATTFLAGWIVALAFREPPHA